MNDALRGGMLTRQTLPSGIMPLREHQRVAGFAFTIKGAYERVPGGSAAARGTADGCA